MSQTCARYTLAAILFFAFAAAIPFHAQGIAPTTPPDSTLFTTYTLFTSGGQTTANWIVCGSTAQTSGCYASGSLGPFVGVGAMMEGIPSVKSNVVTRAIYIVDSGDASSVKLYVYKKTDTVTSQSDTVSVTLLKTVDLPLTGGSTAVVSMAANPGFLLIGTDQSPQAVEVKKSNLSVTQLGGFSPPINVTAITADQYGYVTVTQGTSAFPSGFTVIGPNGSLQEDGGGTDFMLGTMQGVVPTAALGGATAPPVRQLGYWPKASQESGAK
jgi:hypothetical protein